MIQMASNSIGAFRKRPRRRAARGSLAFHAGETDEGEDIFAAHE
jgi:hypothetical protein